MLEMAGKFPVHVSLNTREGEEECQLFFPEGYVNGNEGPDEDEEGTESAADEASDIEETADKLAADKESIITTERESQGGETNKDNVAGAGDPIVEKAETPPTVTTDDNELKPAEAHPIVDDNSPQESK